MKERNMITEDKIYIEKEKIQLQKDLFKVYNRPSPQGETPEQSIELFSNGFADAIDKYVAAGTVVVISDTPDIKIKGPISNIATVGFYYWKQGSDFVKYAEQMINKNIRVNNEFYVCPVFNQAIEDNKEIRTFNINGMWGLGTPEDLNYYLENYK